MLPNADSQLPAFEDNLLVPSSRVKQSKKNTGNTYLCSYTGNGVGSDWFSKNIMLANSVIGVRRGKDRKGVEFLQGNKAQAYEATVRCRQRT